MEVQTVKVEEEPSAWKKKIANAITSALLLLGAIVGAVALVPHSSSSSSDAMRSIKLICRPTHYRHQCEDALSQSAPANSTSDPKLLLQTLFELTSDQLVSVLQRSKFLHHRTVYPTTKSALSNCTSLLHRATDELNTSIDHLAHLLDITRIHIITDDLKLRLGKVLNYEETCIHGLRNTTGNAVEWMRKSLTASLQLSRNSVAIVDNISEVIHSFDLR